MKITITGSRKASQPRAWEAFEFMAPFVASGHSFYDGGAIGVDTWALAWLVERQAAVTVVVPRRVDDQPALARDRIRAAEWHGQAEVVELNHPAFPDVEAYHARNRWMLDRSDLVIGYPLAGGASRGTWYTIGYAADRGLPRLIVPVSAE